MQEINLLQNKLKDRSDSWDRKNMVITIALGVVTAAILGAGGFLYFLNQKTSAQVNDVKIENTTIQTKLNSKQGDLADAKSFQAQLQNIDQLLTSHIYWSPVLDEIQASILKLSKYGSFAAKPDGKVHVEGLAGSYTDIGKLMLSLTTNENLEKVKLNAVQRSAGAQAGYTFSIDFTVKTELLTKR